MAEAPRQPLADQTAVEEGTLPAVVHSVGDEEANKNDVSLEQQRDHDDKAKDDDPLTCPLVKGDLVRVSEEGYWAERRLKDRFGCIGRINKFEGGLYDIEWVVDRGGAQGVKRDYLVRSADEEETSNTRRKRKQPASFMKEKILGSADISKLKKSEQLLPDVALKPKPKLKSLTGRKLPMTVTKPALVVAKPKASAKKAVPKTRPTAAKSAATPATKTAGVKRKAPVKVSVAAKKQAVEAETSPKSSDMFERHRREFERTLERLEKIDKFGFFLDKAPPEYDEEYFAPVNGTKASNIHSSGDDDGECSVPLVSETALTGDSAAAPLNGVFAGKNGSAKPTKAKENKKDDDAQTPQFPLHAPYNWAMIRRRMENGRYIVDRDKAEEIERFRVMKPYYAGLPLDKRPKKRYYNGKNKSNPRVVQKIGMDWGLLLSDIIGMCDAAVLREPDESNGERGTCSHAAMKVIEVAKQACEQKGARHRSELETADDIHRFMTAIDGFANTEAAMQSWRMKPFEERRYERLTNDVICAGLSDVDEQAATHELRTNLPDSFVGLSYRYDDTGQSEAWMKSVVDETGSGIQHEDKVRQAQLAMAADDGVVRAQVNATMNSLLIGIQDKVMTETGVLNEPELRSANWLQALADEPSKRESDDVCHSPEVIEQPVWGIDCYTRRNITTCLEVEFDPDTALEFVEKWLLPAINACPGDLGHDIDNACKILVGLPLTFAATCRAGGDAASLAGQDRQNILREALLEKIRSSGPAWLTSVANELRRARSALGTNFFRVHPKGHGSILLCPRVEANTLVTFYRGEVYPGWRWCEKMDAIEKTQQRKSLKPALPDFYNMGLERPQTDPRGYGLLVVDASRKAGHGSSVSHSCAPTCEVRVTALDGVLCLAMTTIRELEMGEELTFDYNAVTESLVEYSSAICLCGYGKCRGSFLHYATADCYQQVLNRNAPLASRFATLVKASMKQVMADDDERVLRSHGFQTAAFGAISFNRREQESNGGRESSVDAMDFVPIWLRTFVADTLRYIEYERRALPIALICDHLTTKQDRLPIESVAAALVHKEPSKPEPAFFYFVRTEENLLLSFIGNGDGDLTGLHRKHALNKVGAAYWNKLTDEEKKVYKDRARVEFEKKKKAVRGGSKKLKMEKKSKLITTKAEQEKKRPSTFDVEEIVHSPSVSFQDADGEGISAMEQRIQQLTQTLSRIGRVLDRHREHLIEEEGANGLTTSELDPSSLQSLVHSPVSILSDASVVGWLWNSNSGVLKRLLVTSSSAMCIRPLFTEKLRHVEQKYSVLHSFGDPTAKPSVPLSGAAVSGSEGRRILSTALLEIRRTILNEIRDMGKLYKRHKALLRDAAKGDVQTIIEADNDALINRADIAGDDVEDVEFSRQVATDQSFTMDASVTPESTIVGAIMKEMVDRVEQRHLEDIVVDHRDLPRSSDDVASTTEAAQVEDADCIMNANPWLNHYHERSALIAAADLILFYAHTKNFFTLNPYIPLISTPIDVYARELGNAVPRSVIDEESASELNNKMTDASASMGIAASTGEASIEMCPAEMNDPGRAHKASAASIELCDPAETVAKVTVSYNGDYVVSQLLQWYNGGIGQKPGLPDVYGCMVLPSIDSCWSSDLFSRSKVKSDRRTVYETKVRPRMIAWLQDPYQRGNQWPDEVHKAFMSSVSDPLKEDTSSLWLPIGSPVVDFLVTGDESSITSVLAELDADDKVASKVGPGGLLASVDKGRPAQAVCSWVQCENQECNKWRKIPWHVDIDLLPEKFYCKDNKWEPSFASCEIPEDCWDEDDKLVKGGKVEGSPVRKNKNASLSPAVESNFYVGARFDVQRSKKSKFSVGTVTKFDFSGKTKRIMFHFQRASDESDEWVEFGSARIAPLYSKVQRNAKKSVKVPLASGQVEKTDEQLAVANTCVSDTTMQAEAAAMPCPREVDIGPPGDHAAFLEQPGSSRQEMLVPLPAPSSSQKSSRQEMLVPLPAPSSSQKITPSPKNGSSSTDASAGQVDDRKSVRTRPVPNDKKTKKPKSEPATFASSHLQSPPPKTYQSNKVYEALSLRALDHYKEKTSPLPGQPSPPQNQFVQDAPVPFGYGNITDPRYLGFMDALRSASYFPGGAPPHPPPPTFFMPPPNGAAPYHNPWYPPMYHHGHGPGRDASYPPPFPSEPGPASPSPLGALDLLTQAASVRSSSQNALDRDAPSAQGQDPHNINNSAGGSR